MKIFQPLVSVAVATYNGEKYLRLQIDSLLQQTYTKLEIVISDDQSSDGTISLIKEYMARDSRIKYVINKRGQGVINNFTEAISHCSGEVIFLCDQDDWWYPEKIALHLEAYQDPSVMWVYNEIRLTNKAGEGIGFLTDAMPDYWARRKLLYYTWGSCILGCATSYRANLIKDIWPADPRAPGHDSWIQLAIYPAHSVHIPTVMQDYRQHENNVVGFDKEKQFDEALEKKAISDNLQYLKSLSSNKKLSFWKRIFFRLVLSVKLLRKMVLQ